MIGDRLFIRLAKAASRFTGRSLCFVLAIGVIVSWIWQKSRPDLYSRIGSTIYDDRTEALTDMTTPVGVAGVEIEANEGKN